MSIRKSESGVWKMRCCRSARTFWRSSPRSQTAHQQAVTSPGAGSVVPSGPKSRRRTYSKSAGSFDAAAISWEVFFDHRARDAIGNGGQALLNPTNGSSYWLTIVQT